MTPKPSIPASLLLAAALASLSAGAASAGETPLAVSPPLEAYDLNVASGDVSFTDKSTDIYFVWPVRDAQ